MIVITMICAISAHGLEEMKLEQFQDDKGESAGHLGPLGGVL